MKEYYYDYYPFGKIRRSLVADTPVATFKLTGKELDDENRLDWHYFGACSMAYENSFTTPFASPGVFDGGLSHGIPLRD
ncbi:hypothetical protein JW964_03425 [candidate division KSB1 bacterium]|nr:hypothetical protein [candidate division KSB1 bacterium]